MKKMTRSDYAKLKGVNKSTVTRLDFISSALNAEFGAQ
jgi:hypothetical protein